GPPRPTRPGLRPATASRVPEGAGGRLARDMSDAAIRAALARAAEDAAEARPPLPVGAAELRPRRRLAIGDPPAPVEKFFAILDRRSLLVESGPRAGRLAEDVALVSMGDHFDWGPPESRAAATAGGLALLAWLAAHPAEQTAIVVGNHDLARVGEL